MFTATGVGRRMPGDYTFYKRFASVLFRRQAGLEKWPSECQVTTVGAQTGAPGGMPRDCSPSMGVTRPGGCCDLVVMCFA